MSQTGSAMGEWRKSTRCESQHCVEVAPVDGGIAVRDSTDPGRHITFTASAWKNFVAVLAPVTPGKR